MIAAVNHIEAVLKAAKLLPVYDNDDLEQNPNKITEKALVEIGDSSCVQEATHFQDSLDCSLTIYSREVKKGLELTEKIRKDLTSRETTGIIGVIFERVAADENSYVEKMKSYKLNFKILTITAR